MDAVVVFPERQRSRPATGVQSHAAVEELIEPLIDLPLRSDKLVGKRQTKAGRGQSRKSIADACHGAPPFWLCTDLAVTLN
jgi:hypothetical protein